MPSRKNQPHYVLPPGTTGVTIPEINPPQGKQGRYTNQLQFIAYSVLNRLNNMKEFAPFKAPVDPALVPVQSYYNFIKNPMDSATIRKRITAKFYNNAEECLEDFTLLFNNAYFYNYPNTPTWNAAKLCEMELLVKLFEMPEEEVEIESMAAKSDEVISKNVRPTESFLRPKIIEYRQQNQNETTSSSPSSKRPIARLSCSSSTTTATKKSEKRHSTPKSKGVASSTTVNKNPTNKPKVISLKEVKQFTEMYRDGLNKKKNMLDELEKIEKQMNEQLNRIVSSSQDGRSSNSSVKTELANKKVETQGTTKNKRKVNDGSDREFAAPSPPGKKVKTSRGGETKKLGTIKKEKDDKSAMKKKPIVSKAKKSPPPTASNKKRPGGRPKSNSKQANQKQQPKKPAVVETRAPLDKDQVAIMSGQFIHLPRGPSRYELVNWLKEQKRAVSKSLAEESYYDKMIPRLPISVQWELWERFNEQKKDAIEKGIWRPLVMKRRSEEAAKFYEGDAETTDDINIDDLEDGDDEDDNDNRVLLVEEVTTATAADTTTATAADTTTTDDNNGRNDVTDVRRNGGGDNNEKKGNEESDDDDDDDDDDDEEDNPLLDIY